MVAAFPAVSSRFEILRRLGAGGMGVVYEALDTARNARVALKTLRDIEASALLRFKTEFRALQDLVHPNLISLDELVEEDGQWFFTMELVSGVDFLSHVRAQRSADGEGRVNPDDETMIDWSRPSLVDTRRAKAEQADLGYDESRLRASLTQLATGLLHLHGARKVHRDIKPSNVLVTPEGRVVLLDFGLVTDHRGSESTDANIVGTAAYMAPEQAAAKPIGPEADWYAVGVVLYEALTGRLPFDGSAIQILMAKQVREPTPPKELVATIPDDLDALCVELLRFDPAKRPTGAEIARKLGIQNVARGASLAPASLTSSVPFVGRGQELSQLDRAYEMVRAGKAVTVYVHGESGVGKSALVERFVSRLAESDGRPMLTLRGRCYERESVPYKAMDGIIDALSRALMRLKSREVADLLPVRAALLAQVFPVLRRVEAFANAPRVSFDVLDPQELRGRLFGAVRELFQSLSARARIVAVIDDLQWADADSMALLREVMRVPEAPPMLLLLTVRGAPQGATPTSQLNAGSAMLPGEVRVLPVNRLSGSEALDLAHKLVARVGPDASMSAEDLVREAQGHPLFLEELARHSALVGPAGASVSRLEDALWERVTLLPDPARALLTVLSVAGHPVGREELEHAARLEEGVDVERNISALRAGRFVRSSNVAGKKTLEPLHDKVRASVVAHVGAQQKCAIHGRLALALEATPGPDAEALAEHWRGAGEPEKAARYAEQAAGEALSAFAFERAARLYRLVLVLRTPPEDDLRALRRKLGDTLSNAGRGAEAAEMYLEAALGASTAEALELRRRAATQLLLSGHIEEGISTFRNVLKALGLEYPESTAAAWRSRLLRRAWLKVRGLSFRPRDTSAVAESDRVRIDVCWSVGLGLGMVDPSRGADFQIQGLLRALSSGDAYRISRALALEGAYVASLGSHREREVMQLIERAEELAKSSRSAHATGIASLARAFALHLWGRYSEVLPHAEHAEQLFRERCVGAQTEVDIAVLLSVRALFFRGDLRELCSRMPVHLREASERGNLYALHGLRTSHLVGAWLAQDDPEGASAELEDAARSWHEEQGLDLRALQAWLGRATIALYRGDPKPLFDEGNELKSRLDGAPLWHIQQERVDWAWSQARLAIAVNPRDEGIETLIRSLERESVPIAPPVSALLRAAQHRAHGRVDEARGCASTAVTGFETQGLAAFACLARRAVGILQNDARGAAASVDAQDELKTLGATNPQRFAAAYSPGFDG